MDYVSKARIGRLIAIGKCNGLKRGAERAIAFSGPSTDERSVTRRPQLVLHNTDFQVGEDIVTA